MIQLKQHTSKTISQHSSMMQSNIPSAFTGSDATIPNTHELPITSSSLGVQHDTAPSITPSIPAASSRTNVHSITATLKSVSSRFFSSFRQQMAFRPPVKSDPRLLPKRKKHWIITCLALGSSLNGLCSTIYFPGIPDITQELDASPISVTLTTSLFILFGGLGPILWASMSDYYHIRRFLYLTSLLIFTAASVGCALVSNIYLLIVLRCIQSVGTSVTTSVGAGTVADCWEVTERGGAFSVLFMGQFLGPLIGPVLGGGLTTGLGWRSTFWFCTGYGLFLFCFLVFFLPETYRIDREWDLVRHAKPHEQPTVPQVVPEDQLASDTSTLATINSSRHDVERQEDPANPVSEKGVPKKLNPLQSLYLLRHTFVWLVALEIGVCFGTMFTIETVIPNLYEQTYNFESWQTGLSFLGAGVGNLVGSVVSGKMSDYLIKRARKKRGGAARTEDRLTLNAWPGGFLLVPIGVCLFGWTVAYALPVYVAIISFAIVCFGMSQVYAAGSAYLVDAIPGRGASVTASSNMVRMTIACILSLIAQPVVDSIGPGYLGVILAGLSIISTAFLFLVKKRGQDMRRRAGYGDNVQ